MRLTITAAMLACGIYMSTSAVAESHCHIDLRRVNSNDLIADTRAQVKRQNCQKGDVLSWRANPQDYYVVGVVVAAMCDFSKHVTWAQPAFVCILADEKPIRN